MDESPDPAVIDLATKSLLEASRRLALRALESPAEPSTADYRRVERSMRIALALATGGAESRVQLQIHGLPPDPDAPFAVPETFHFEPARLLAAPQADLLPDALAGKREALEALVQEAERILVSEDIQII